jgi:hypothetical protein
MRLSTLRVKSGTFLDLFNKVVVSDKGGSSSPFS